MLDERPQIHPVSIVGSVLTISGAQMTVRVNGGGLDERTTRIGSMVKAQCMRREVVGAISAVETDSNASEQAILVVDLVGELARDDEGSRFIRGVSHHPIPGARVLAATDDDLRVIFARPSEANIRLGTLYDNSSQPAYTQIDDLLSKHFAVLGTSGSAKSCTVALMLTNILYEHPNAHVLLL